MIERAERAGCMYVEVDVRFGLGRAVAAVESKLAELAA